MREDRVEKERIDEGLELLWLLDEEGHPELERFRLRSDDPDFQTLLDILGKDGLVNVDALSARLTEKGHIFAKGLIRRHRLAERLFTDVFDLKADQVHDDACRMEHILSEELTDSVCTFLGHPPTCPHGKSIPRGECCKKYKTEVVPVVVRLSDFEIGSKGRIVFVARADVSRINRLGAMGIVPGNVIRLIQRLPSYVVQVDETTIAIDYEMAKEIYVKKAT